MNREILFRGKDKKTGEWRLGYYRVGSFRKNAMIDDPHNPASYEVDPETVGQWTGLLDKNGTKIFEGDMFKIFHFTDGRRKKHFLYHVVQWSDKYAGWIACNTGDKTADPKNGSPLLWCYVKNEFEIAGNIHDNSELLHAN